MATVARRIFARDGLICFVADCYITRYRPIEQLVKQTKPLVKRNEEVAATWKDYQKTGLHATLDQLNAWLATWGTSDALPMPEPLVLGQSGTSLLGLRGTAWGTFGIGVGQTISELRDEWE